jgi:hypothetical protein
MLAGFLQACRERERERERESEILMEVLDSSCFQVAMMGLFECGIW